jgi:hypothetical protein
VAFDEVSLDFLLKQGWKGCDLHHLDLIGVELRSCIAIVSRRLRVSKKRLHIRMMAVGKVAEARGLRADKCDNVWEFDKEVQWIRKLLDFVPLRALVGPHRHFVQSAWLFGEALHRTDLDRKKTDVQKSLQPREAKT